MTHQGARSARINIPLRAWRFWLAIFGLLLLAALPITATRDEVNARDDEGEARQSDQVLAAVVHSPSGEPLSAPAAPAIGFVPQTRLGYTAGDQWEPAIAADRFGHIYVLYPQYHGVPACPDCHSP